MLPLKTSLAALAAPLLLAAALAGCQDRSPAQLRAEAQTLRQKGEYSAALILLKNAAEGAPDDPDTRLQLASLYIDTGDAPSAEKEARMALALGAPHAKAFPMLGKSLLLQSRFQQVLDDSEREAIGNGADLLCVRADAFLGLGQRDQARQLYDRVLQARPTYIPALIGRGRLAYLERDLGLANNYAAQALAASPRDTDALLFQGDLLRAGNDPGRALASYDQVLKINPAHRSAHVEKAYLEIGLNRFEAAQADLDAARKTTPGSVLVAYTQALLDFSQGKPEAAHDSLLKVLRVAPEHMPSVLLAGTVNLNLGSLYQAEHHFRHYLESHPDSLYARKMLASTLLRTGHTPDALATLAPALKEGSGQDVQLLALAGESHMQARDFTQAAEFFGRASELDPKAANLRTSLGLSELGKGDRALAVRDLQAATTLDLNSLRAGIALVRTELELQHFDSAFEAVVALERAQPKSAAVQELKGMVYAGKHDPAQARASFRQALALDPSYFPAAANLAQLELRDNKPAAAREQLALFLTRNKDSIDAMTAMATIASAERRPDEATRWLEQASAVDPSAVGPAVNLIAQYLRSGHNLKALNLARKLQVTHPDNPDLLDLLGKSQLANGEQVNALETYKKLALALPRSAHAQMQVAALQLLLNNPTGAEDYLKTALALQPDFPAAQLALAELHVRRGWFDLALMIAERLQKNYPKASAGFQLEGDILMGKHRPAQALAAYEQALAFSPSSELLVKTVHALREAGKRDEAGKRLGQWLAQHPDDVRVRLFKAETLLADKEYKAGAAQLEAVLKLHPQNVAALNNLALAYQQANDARAEQVARQAWELAKEQPVVMDTLGWILVDKGDAARGLEILKQANVRSPQARDIRYHLAVGLYKTGNKAAARKELVSLAAGDMRFAQADEVRALLKQLE